MTGSARAPALCRAAIVEAGRHLVAAEGMRALTMRRIAAELRCSPMALYRHVADKRELVVLMLDDAARELVTDVPATEPVECVVQLFEEMYAFLTKHAWVTEVLREGELFAPGSLRFGEAVLDALAAADLTGPRALTTHLALWSFLIGHLTSAHPADPATVAGRYELADRAPLDELPRVRAMLPLFAAHDHEQAFHDGLRLIVTALLAPGRREER